MLFKGKRYPDSPTRIFVTKTIDGVEKPLSPKRSLSLADHSPDGFNWGYGGSGPAQLALALLLEVTDNDEVAGNHYQDFKWGVVAHFDYEWEMSAETIMEWLDEHHRVRDRYGIL